ncbi:YchJ family protein [Streptomyces sp. NPDC002490]|uniref:YchJ family protein n=1 Tax=Streptomyces sp. NPDC002490 TaxID=3154416 RepID=UPI003326BA9C
MARRTHRTARPSRSPQARRTAAVPVGCPCGSGAGYAGCCGRLHRGEASAPTAEALMRSRYAAYAVGDAGHLLRTWDPATRPAVLDLDDGPRWTGLEILDTTEGSAFHQRGTVTFRASYAEAGRPGVLVERSTFRRVDGAWVYVDGTFPEDAGDGGR